ncbi:MAG: siroheme synthase [Nitriliruptorales bacterium]|nr:siroheme synthase [Nitriliruptorales bacterium]
MTSGTADNPSSATVPLFVRFDGARVVSVGAGPVAASKALPLLDAGADLVVVAPTASPDIARAAAAGRLTWHRRGFQEADLEGAVLVIAATADPERNAAVARAAADRATLCVRVDRGGQGTAALAGVVRRGALTLAVSTSDQAPALARHLRTELDGAYGPEWGELVALYAELRSDPEIADALAGLTDVQRRARWRAIPVPDILRLIRTGRHSDAKRVASACLSSSSG